ASLRGRIDAARFRMAERAMDTRIASFAFLVAIAACGKKTAPPAPPPPSVQVVAVERMDVPIYREWVGTLDGFVNADIRPQVEGYIRKQAYREGAPVTRGDLLFLIDPRNYEAVANQAKATLDRNLATLEKARLDVKRDRQLIAQNVIPQQQLDNDLTAEAQAAANVDSARATLAQARLNRGWTEVTSPIDGVAGIAQAQVGNLVSTSTVMTTVSQVDPIKASFNISEAEYLHSARGNHWAEPARGDNPILELILEDGSVYPPRGTVVVTNRQVDPRTGTITLQGAFPNPGNVLRPGQYGKVRAAIETRKGALVVPQRAISELQGSYQVGVVSPDGKVDLRTVRAGEQVGNQLLVVEDGLQAGEKVIVEGFARVRPGMLVRATPALDGSTASATPEAPPAGR
ncbi:MAG TPA: efflux RND transporter periplasmic adaptor subunit, partial [Gemmatimonadaceae bacterium]|nr:efflux RND transporter periplasmic adaptor subunit [Gemmatimonadaceae bacterium]